MAKTYGSKRELEKDGGNFKPFKSGSYIARLVSNEVKEKKNYDGDVVPTLCLQFSPYEANARTPIIKDVDGATVKPLTRKLFLDIDKVTMGFRENFTIPSKYRALAAALQGMDPNEDVPGPDELTADSAYDQIQEYLGNYVVVNVTAYEKNGKWRNKITDFQPVPEDFEADPVVEAAQEDAAKKRAANKDSGRQAEDGDEEEVEELEESTETDAPSKKTDTKKPLF